MDGMQKKKKILAADDELVNRKVIAGFLKAFGHDYQVVETGGQLLELLDESVDLVLTDILMPGMNGFDLCRAIRAAENVSDVPIILVTSLDNKDDRLRAVEAGANDFVSKPIDRTELKVRMDSILKMKEARDEVKRYQAELEQMVQIRTEALRMTVDNLTVLHQATLAAHLETIYCLASAAEYKDEETAEHIKRMSHTSAVLARGLGVDEEEVALILHASPMHDIGKIGIPDAILLKPGPLDADEWMIMKRHTTIGAAILHSTSSEYLEVGRSIALSHHEKWDGSGYPRGLAGEDIPLCGRISAVADVFDALLSKRPYKEPFPLDKSLDIIRSGRGSHFDPTVVDVFFENLDEIMSIRERFSD